VARQTIDQSPLAFDQLVFRDLVADYASQVDAQVIAGNGTNGTILGILQTAGIQTVAASALTIQGVYAAMANAIQKVHGARFQPPTAVFMHPRRWGWFQSLLDTTNRPLFPPVAQFPQNAAGILTNVASEQVVGNMQGLPIVTDPNFPVNLGPEIPADAEMFAILDHDCRDRHLWALALYGLRRGEIAGLRWANVDLKAKTVSVVQNRVPIGKQVIVGTPKSKASNRTLPMPGEVVELLKAARKRQAEERLAFGEGYGSGEYVASDETGQPYRPQLLTLRWGRMLDQLDIERVRLHDARHSCATLMHLRQVPIAVIAAWLGHASAAFTMSVYAHSPDDALKAAASSFGRVVTIGDIETGSQP
jgi:hypothetical protein